jgi:hypothetical protein
MSCMIYITDEISKCTLQGHEIVHFYRTSRPNLWPIQLPFQLVLRAFSPRVECEADHTFMSCQGPSYCPAMWVGYAKNHNP